MEALVQDLVKSSLTQLGVIPQETPGQSQAQSDIVEPEPPQVEDIASEGEVPNSDQEGGVLDACLQNLSMWTSSQTPESEASLIAKQAWSEFLNRFANFSELKRGDTEEPKWVMGMKRPLYHDPARSTINLALPWHSVAEEMADVNLKIVTGQLNKRMKPCYPAKPWGSREFFMGIGYHTHNLEGYVPYPESLVIPSKPPTEQTAEDQPFCLVHL